MSKRHYKQGIAREQSYLLPPQIADYVAADNPVRAIDAYVASLDLSVLGFARAQGGRTRGQPAYSPQGLLRLYLYGYLHRVRSSRRLEAECQRNLEVIWLLGGLQPTYKTIADFRKNNLKALQQVNRDFVQLCKELDLFGGELVGIDGSFFRGNVAKDSVYTAERLKRALEQLDTDIARYLQELDQADAEGGDPAGADPQLGQKLEQLRARQQKRQAQLQQLAESGQSQIAEVDPDARLLHKTGQATIAGYNVQTAVDAKHKLLVVAEVTQDGNDERQLAPMGKAAKAELGVEQLETTQDQGYFNAQQIQECEQNGITPYVPEPNKTAQARQAGRFARQDFGYDAQHHCYHCPQGETLSYSSQMEKHGKRMELFRSRVSVCATCPLKGQCLPAKTRYRTLARWEHEALIEAHRKRMAREGANKMRQRSGICEHPFGTLKVWCGWTHFLLRGLQKVRAELSLLMLAYNFKRVLSLVGEAALRAYCERRSRKLTMVSP